MQLVADDLKASAGHEPLDPVQVSARSHWPADARHTVLLDWKTSTHAPLVPEQWSAVSSSHAPPCDVPVQLVPDVLKASRQVFAVPEQWSAASSSHAPPCEAPVQVVDDDLKASTGHVPLDPVQLSATSH